MKKRIIISTVVMIALLLVLFLPIPQGTYDDGGTRDYNALTYKIVVWNKIMDGIDENGQTVHNTYRNTSVFWYPDNQKSIDELWQIEKVNAKLDTPQQPTTNTNATKPSDDEIQYDGPVQLHPLYEKYPEYFNLDTMKGLEIYVWQMAGNLYHSGVLSGTNRMKTQEEIQNLMGNGATIEEMKDILSAYEIEKESVIIYPVHNPVSSYWYEIDDEYQAKIEAMFWGE